jgi:hypothetical protein
MLLGNTSHYVNDLMGLAIKYSIPIIIVDPYADYKKRNCWPKVKHADYIVIDGIYLL